MRLKEAGSLQEGVAEESLVGTGTIRQKYQSLQKTASVTEYIDVLPEPFPF